MNYYNNKSLKRSVSVFLSILLVFSLILNCNFEVNAAINPDYKTFVMAPLEKIEDWNSFKNKLSILKKNGIDGITTDIWWGYVEDEADNKFQWDYYKAYANAVRDSGLKWVPIISTHQCGGNVNDTVNILMPSWLWTKDTAENMQFKDEKGNLDKEVLSVWWKGAIQQYEELYTSFASNFSEYKDIIDKIYLSCGPSGELRYPSYNKLFKWEYPDRGYLQCYSESAKADFQNTMKMNYGNIEAINTAWGTNLTDFSQISPPLDGDNFFVDVPKSTYKKDLMNWYQGALSKHLANVAAKAHACFDPVFNVRIGAKVSGVHWLMNSKVMPHAAEYCAGYYDYNTLLDEFKKSDVDLTFTCLEMDNSKKDSNPEYSEPKTLVENVATIANSKNIRHFGENALPILNNVKAYENCAEMLFNYNFSGFTLLRLSNLINNDNGSATSEMAPFVDNIVRKPVKVTFTVTDANTKPGENIYVSGEKWELSNWNEGNYALPLQYNDGKWIGSTYLGAGRKYEFKAIKKDGTNVIWQGGNKNESYTVPSNGGSYTWKWIDQNRRGIWRWFSWFK